MFSRADYDFMTRALQLAQRGLCTTMPNPRVGCVLVKESKIVGEGWHERAGTPHAEVNALQMAGSQAEGATAYITLEPCSHFGRTPPCVDALIAARVARVFAAMQDPNPHVAGAGLQRLRAAGIEVRCGLLEREARLLNVGFISRMTRKRPWVRSKLAMSLDGKTALLNGNSQWITGSTARADGHQWRARACAILTGSGTVHTDDPRLNVRSKARDVQITRQPIKVVVDGRLLTSTQARLLEGAPTWFATAVQLPEQEVALRAHGADILHVPGMDGKVDLAALMQVLGEREINELHVEAGTRLNTALLQAGLIDELLLYVAPTLIGPGRGLFDLPALENLDDVQKWEFIDTQMLGSSLRMRLQRKIKDDLEK